MRGKRVIVAGTGPLLLAVADLPWAAGAVVPLIHKHAGALTFTRNLAATFSLRPELLKLARPDTLVCRVAMARPTSPVGTPLARHFGLSAAATAP